MVDELTQKDFSFPIDEETLNVIDQSKLTTFLACRRKFLFEYVFGWRSEEPSKDLVFGTAIHEALRVLRKRWDYSKESVLDSWENVFLPVWRESFSENWDSVCSPKNPIRAKEGLLTWAGQNSSDLEEFKVLSLERAGQVPVTKSWKLSFRLDAELQRLSDELVEIHDYKTSKNYSDFWINQWLLNLQAWVYNHAGTVKWRKKFSHFVADGLFFRKVKDDSKAVRFETHRQDVFKTPEEMQVGLAWVRRYFEQLETEFELLKTETESSKVLKSFPGDGQRCQDYARTCPFRQMCSTCTNPIQLKLKKNPPTGLKVEFWNPLKETV